MAMRKRTRDQQVARVEPMLPAGSTVRGYAVGRGHARLTSTAIVLTSVFAAAFLIFAVVFHVVLIPGILLVAVLVNEVRPMRGVALTEHGLALVSRSSWTGRPKGLVGLMGPVPLTDRTISFGTERVTLGSGELAELQRAAAGLAAPPTGYPGPPSYPGTATPPMPPGMPMPPSPGARPFG
jgi:hypothetical protein